jgi:hypothetical protein
MSLVELDTNVGAISFLKLSMESFSLKFLMAEGELIISECLCCSKIYERFGSWHQKEDLL